MVDWEEFDEGEGKKICGNACWEGDARNEIPGDSHAVLKSVACVIC